MSEMDGMTGDSMVRIVCDAGISPEYGTNYAAHMSCRVCRLEVDQWHTGYASEERHFSASVPYLMDDTGWGPTGGIPRGHRHPMLRSQATCVRTSQMSERPRCRLAAEQGAVCIFPSESPPGSMSILETRNTGGGDVARCVIRPAGRLSINKKAEGCKVIYILDTFASSRGGSE